MPSNVSNYLWLNILGLAIGLVTAYFGFDDAVAKMPIAGAARVLVIIDVVIFSISIGLIAAVVWGRQNWARWVQLVFYALGLLGMAIGFQKMLESSSFQIGTTVLQLVISGLALFFIFTGNAKEWFLRDRRD